MIAATPSLTLNVVDLALLTAQHAWSSELQPALPGSQTERQRLADEHENAANTGRRHGVLALAVAKLAQQYGAAAPVTERLQTEAHRAYYLWLSARYAEAAKATE